ncbi:MAG: type II-A CRISPR-associated protein Csn2 [Ruminococcaceae bacterium]|nr:type II-A CRISPR-associated protein Csn2 [Oscillospiraceae bacterium]
MILAHPQLDTVLEFDGNGVNALVVENPDFYRSLLCDLYGQLQGDEGKLILSEKGKTLPIGKWVELVDNCIHFELNRKSLLTKVCAAMERTAVSEGFFLKTSELLSELERYVDELAFELPGDIVCEKCSVAGLLKGIGISLRDAYEDPLERLLDFMELVREFDRDKLFVIVGLRSFFSDGRVGAFLKTAAGHGYRILLMDCIAREKLPGEKRLTIDIDLCEF